jgi:hypothetical protein
MDVYCPCSVLKVTPVRNSQSVRDITVRVAPERGNLNSKVWRSSSRKRQREEIITKETGRKGGDHITKDTHLIEEN